ncbi:MAG: mandelate racemase/muconate lactonizing enzyme family protein [Paludibacter sp.]|jgi:L-alanine-DL-glutamate epimerase-like enolase superfamily enzyme|nr:mandelate racemase/muconate lactonizing enzyme family protein [Paludibacter sp.]
MKFTRREWLKTSASAALLAALPSWLYAENKETAKLLLEEGTPFLRDFEEPLFNLHSRISTPVIIESVELLKKGSYYFVRTRSTDGAVGITGTKQMNDFVPIFQNLVAPHFIGKDARDIESLVDSVYRANYKLAGIPFWSPVAYIEQSLLDMLGKIANKPVYELLGGKLRDEIPVYLSGSDRILTAEEEVEIYVRGIAETGAKAVKFKIGGRMSRNLDTYEGRTETLVKLARKKLGDEIFLAADANGSYDVKKGIEIGKLLESLNYKFFEEPCPWENLSETQAVANALKITISAGEQDSSLWRFGWMLQNGVMQIAQPDINYNGGLIRAKRVAAIAQKLGKTIVPHNTQTGHVSVNILQFAACTPNAMPYMEYPWRKPQVAPTWYKPDFKIVDGKIKVPKTPGMGLEIDPDFLKDVTVIFKTDKSGGGKSSGSGS